MSKKGKKLLKGGMDKFERTVSSRKFVTMSQSVTFVLSVWLIVLTTVIMVTIPDRMWKWYLLWWIPLLLMRCYSYSKQGWLYFTIDFCYFTHLLLILFILVYPSAEVLFVAVFSVANGPLLWAIIVWRNSLVLHDIDRMTSLFLHIIPSVVTTCIRWHPTHFLGVSPSPKHGMETASWIQLWLVPCCLYLFWQVSYFVKVDILDVRHVPPGVDPPMTSYRHFASKKHSAPALMLRPLPPKWRPYGFMALQLVFTALTLIPSFLMFESFLCNILFILFTFAHSTYSGSTYYVVYLMGRGQATAEADAVAATPPRPHQQWAVRAAGKKRK